MTQSHTVSRIAISLPASLLRRLEGVRRTTGENRSALIRRALEELFFASRRARKVAEYIEGYARKPETRAEVATVRKLAARAFEENPWE